MIEPQHYATPMLPGHRLERWPTTCEPPAGEMVFVDTGTPDHLGKQVPASLIDGTWCGLNRKPLSFAPTHWERLVAIDLK